MVVSRNPPGHHRTFGKPHPLPFSSPYELKSLPLNHSDHFVNRRVEPVTNALFAPCPQAGMWFVVHPDFRREPGMRPGGAWTEDY